MNHNNADYLRALVRFLDSRSEFMNDGKSIKTLISEYSTLTGKFPVSGTPTKYHKAKIRKDLLDSGTSVPVGDGYYQGSKPILYRWVTDDSFQVFFNGKWVEAWSEDWDHF